MLGAIIGDIAGSFREFTGKEKYTKLPLMPELSQIPNNSRTNEPRYGITDDSLLSIVTAKVILASSSPMGNTVGLEDNFEDEYYFMGKEYYDPIGGFGAGFREWLDLEIPTPYNSCGNGSAMRVSPVGWACDTMEETLAMAFQSALPTHNHPEGIKGAQATAAMIFLGRQGHDMKTILQTMDQMYLGYEPVKELGYFDAVCPDTMRLATYVLGTTDSFYSAVFKAVTIPYADADTLGAIVGSIAEAVYGIPKELEERALEMIKQPELREIVDEFRETYCKIEEPA